MWKTHIYRYTSLSETRIYSTHHYAKHGSTVHIIMQNIACFGAIDHLVHQYIYSSVYLIYNCYSLYIDYILLSQHVILHIYITASVYSYVFLCLPNASLPQFITDHRFCTYWLHNPLDWIMAEFKKIKKSLY